MPKSKSFLLFPFLLLTAVVFSQRTRITTSSYAKFDHGLKLFHQHQYKGAQELFDRIFKNAKEPALREKTAYYSALSAVYLGQFNAEDQLQSFVKAYPESPKRNSAYSRVANFYFQKGQYHKAKKWYQHVNPTGLTSQEKRAFYFNSGYTAFKIGHQKKATYYLKKVKNDKKYGSQAKYYLGFMAYKNDNYTRANSLFEGVDKKDKTRKKVSYFQSNMSFKSGDFKKAIKEAKAQLPNATRRERSELHKIIGESYFNLKAYKKAIPHLEKYRGKRGKWSNTDYYQLGFAYYKMGRYKKAVSQFNNIIDGKNYIAQNAYYHLAESYIHLNQKQRALNAFKNASEMDFNATIKKDAALNYAKLSYDIGNNYQSVPEVLTAYLKQYPNTTHREEIQSLLVNSYLTSKNYKKAMALLEKSRHFKDHRVYQKVAFYRGLELYNQGRYTDAVTLFKKSLSEQKDPVYTARALYWKAECAYNEGHFHQALIGYKQFKGRSAATEVSEFKAIDYNIGYAYFNQQKYNLAAGHFQKYLNQSSLKPKQKNDAFLRLGDSYFAQSDYWKAMETYNKAIAQKGVDSDYAYYQKAISYGFVGKNDQKMEDLKAFLKRYPHSLYRDDAYYQLGNTYVAENQSQKAIAAYQQITTKMPKSNYVSRALIKQGLVYYNSGNTRQALTAFKRVAKDYPKTEEANQAIRSARNIYVDLGKIDEYAHWVKSLGYVDVSDEEIDNATYESAENQFLDQEPTDAIKGFKKYLKKFPKGIHALSAHYRLAELFYKKGKHEKARPHYQFIIDQSRNNFTEKSLKRLARIALEKEDYQKAIPLLTRLEAVASLQKNITFSESNLMKAYYEQKNYDKTVIYAEKVLKNEKAEKQARNDAHLFIARSAIKTGAMDKAKKAYKEVAQTAHGKLAAEAQYYDAYFKRRAKNYKASNKSVQELAKDYSRYREFSVKGLLLMAENFYDLNDAYQATYILQNIIDNFSNYPTVISKAKSELTRIKTEQAKTNSSIDTLNTTATDSLKK